MNTSTTLQKLPYYNKETALTKENLGRLGSLTNEQVQQIAIAKTYGEVYNSKPAKAQRALFPAVAATLIGTSVIKQKGPASVKIATALAGVASFAVLKGALNIASKLVAKFTDNNQDSRFKNDIYQIGTIAGAAGLYELASAGIGKAFKGLAKKFPNAAQNIGLKISKFDKGVAKSVFAEKANKYISQPLKNLASKFPKVAKFLGKNTAPIALLAYIGASFALSNKINNNLNKNYVKNINELSDLKDEAKAAYALMDRAEKKYDEKIEQDYVEADTAPVYAAADADGDIDQAANQVLYDTIGA